MKKKYRTKIIMEDNSLIREKSLPVNLPLTQTDLRIINNLIWYMENCSNDEMREKYSLSEAIGISAIQLGFKKQIIAFWSSENNLNVLVNPEISWQDNKKCYLDGGEGCLSVRSQEYNGVNLRPIKIKVKAYNFYSKKYELFNFENIDAIVFHHEYEHLMGKLFIDSLLFTPPYNAIKISHSNKNENNESII